MRDGQGRGEEAAAGHGALVELRRMSELSLGRKPRKPGRLHVDRSRLLGAQESLPPARIFQKHENSIAHTSFGACVFGTKAGGIERKGSST